MKGFGKQVPPLKAHVLIYFLEKGAAESQADAFFLHFHRRQWHNSQSHKLSNWKSAAWEWILKNELCNKFI